MLAAVGALITAVAIAVDAGLYVMGFGLILVAVAVASAVAAKNQYFLQLVTAAGR